MKEEDLFPSRDHTDVEREFYTLYGEKSPTIRMVDDEGIAESFGDVGIKNKFQLNTFNRYYKVFPDDEIGNILSYVFIVRPDLNMGIAIKNDPFFADLANTFPNLVLNLTQDIGINTDLNILAQKCGGQMNHQFVSFLTNRVRSYDIPDVNVKTFDIEQPYTNFHTMYAANSNESRTGHQFSITLRETKNLEITKFFEGWVRYMDGIQLGRYYPKRKYVTSRITNGSSVLDYATSVYLINTLADGEEIVYFHKSTGAFPTTVPHSTWGFKTPGAGSIENEVSIQFTGGLPEPLNPAVLGEFNYNAGVSSLCVSETNYNNPIVGVPFITYSPKRKRFLLRWKPYNS